MNNIDFILSEELTLQLFSLGQCKFEIKLAAKRMATQSKVLRILNRLDTGIAVRIPLSV
jgi:hypothetical protein